MDLAQWMKANDHTDATLAAKVGVSRPFITRIRNNDRQPSLSIAVKLAEFTKLPISSFLKDEAA